MILENEMAEDIYIEDIKTSGTIVHNAVSLIGEAIKKGESKRLNYAVVCPHYNYENNYIVLELYNKSKEDYETIKIAWSIGEATKVIPDNHLENFYRVSQKYSNGNLYFTFYEYDEPNIVKILSLELMLRLKSNLHRQMRESEETIKKQSGLTEKEIVLINYEKYNF